MKKQNEKHEDRILLEIVILTELSEIRYYEREREREREREEVNA